MSRHIAALDGLRGVAVLLVMLTHATEGSAHLQGGSVGVDIFFVLSGFLITYLLVREHDNHAGQISLWRFYARRALRLGPALAVLLVCLGVGGFVFLSHEDARANLIDIVITLGYAVNWARAFDLHSPRLLAHAWSLSIEEQFYLLWPIVLILMLRWIPSRQRIAAIILALVAASYLWRVTLALNGATVERLYNGLDTRADSILLGCAFGLALGSNLISDEAKRLLVTKIRLVPPLTLAILAATVWFATWRAAYAYYWLFAVIEVLAALTILYVFVGGRTLATSVLSTKPLVWIGTISYGLYLWHYPIYRLLQDSGFGVQGIIGGTALAFIVATLSYYAVERPILRRKDRLARSPQIASPTNGFQPARRG